MTRADVGLPGRAEDRTIDQRLDIDIARLAVSERDTHDARLERYRRRDEAVWFRTPAGSRARGSAPGIAFDVEPDSAREPLGLEERRARGSRPPIL